KVYMGAWIHHFSYQFGWYDPVLAAICYEGFWIALLCVYVAECILRKVLPTCNASCGGANLKCFFILEKLLILFLISPASDISVSGSFEDILKASMKPTQSSVLALWLTLNYSIVFTLLLLDTSIMESIDNYSNSFRHSVLATLCFVFTLALFILVRQFYNLMPLEMFSIVAMQFVHMLAKSLRIMLSAERSKEWSASFISRFLLSIGSFFYTLESGKYNGSIRQTSQYISVLVVYFGFFIRGRIFAGVFISQIDMRSRQIISIVYG
ncbi:hypothetical protein PRIPAC_86211, partial [Pristionchus pacificus]